MKPRNLDTLFTILVLFSCLVTCVSFDLIGPEPIRGFGFPPFENPWVHHAAYSAFAFGLMALMMVRR